jgi:predicted metalloprotease with PDZ domain
MEGFTSYYDELLLYRAGIYSEDEIVGKFRSSINNIENQPGNKVQPVAHASFDAWIKAYRPNENSYNTTISYYTKGSVIANMLDLKIINATKGKKSLDDVMKYLYSEYYKKEQRGFTTAEIKKGIETISGLDLTDFFNDYIYGVKTFDYSTIFGYAGFTVETILNQKPNFGVRLSNNFIKSITRNSSAYDGGLNVNDEIIAINGYRVNDNLDDFIENKNVGDNMKVLISRDDIMQTIEFPLKERGYTSYFIDRSTQEMNVVCKKWLRKL